MAWSGRITTLEGANELFACIGGVVTKHKLGYQLISPMGTAIEATLTELCTETVGMLAKMANVYVEPHEQD